MCEVVINGEAIKFEGSVLTRLDLQPYQEMARNIKICDSVAVISDKTFFNFRRLENIEFSDSVRVIGRSSFWGCSSLKAIAFPNSITELRSGICMDCKSLENAIIPDSVKSIGDSAFLECNSLKSVCIPNSVKHIGKRAFCMCASLQNVEIPVSVSKIENGAFWGCMSLKSIHFTDAIAYMGDQVFYNCNSIRLEIDGAGRFLTKKALAGHRGQFIIINMNGEEYILLNYSRLNEKPMIMVITGYVDYADGKLYRGYEFNDELDLQNKKPLYCYNKKKYLFHDTTMDGLKRQLNIGGIC